MTEFKINPRRLDPYKNFKFLVKWDGRVVAGVSKISALKVTREVIDHRSGGDPSTVHHSPGQSKFEPITLERGVTHDRAFEQWSSRVWSLGSGRGNEVSLANFRRNIRIELLNEAGQVAKAWICYRCWVSEYSAIGELDANGNAVVFESIVLQNEGWVLDGSVFELAEPSFEDQA